MKETMENTQFTMTTVGNLAIQGETKAMIKKKAHESCKNKICQNEKCPKRK